MSTPPQDPMTGVAALVTALLFGLAGYVNAKRVESKAQNTPEPATKPRTEPVPLPPVPQTLAEQMQFMELIRADNASLREELGDVKAELAATKVTLQEMQSDLRADKDWKIHFLDALGRWLPRVYHAWGEGGPFPLPEGDDLITLREVVPRN